MSYRFYTVDAFSDTVFQGAPIMVFPEADALTDTQMQQIAREFNFAETVFSVAPTSDRFKRKLRIFTPTAEIPFAGHPTIGAVFVLAHAGIIGAENSVNEYLLQEGSHEVTVRIKTQADNPTFVEFSVNISAKLDSYVPSIPELARFLQLETSDIDTQNFRPLVAYGDKSYLVIPLNEAQRLLAARFSQAEWLKSSTTNTIEPNLLLFCPADKDSSNHFHARLLGSGISPESDPPIGSAASALASYLNSYPEWRAENASFVVQRGAGHERLSTLNIAIENASQKQLTVRVGGHSVLVSEGNLLL